MVINCLTHFLSTNRAREIAVFSRFGQKMNFSAVGSPAVLTADMSMIFFSSPWNSSTVPAAIFFHSFFLCDRSFLIAFTCAKYGEMIPISSTATFLSINFLTNCMILTEKTRNIEIHLIVLHIKYLCKTYYFNLLWVGPWLCVPLSFIFTRDVDKINAKWIIRAGIFTSRQYCAKLIEFESFTACFWVNFCNQLRFVELIVIKIQYAWQCSITTAQLCNETLVIPIFLRLNVDWI